MELPNIKKISSKPHVQRLKKKKRRSTINTVDKINIEDSSVCVLFHSHKNIVFFSSYFDRQTMFTIVIFRR